MSLTSDLTGLRHGTDSPAAVDALDRLQHELLTYGLGGAVAFRAIEADPGFAAGHAVAAAMHLFTMSPEGAARARPLLARAAALVPLADRRETLLVAAIQQWHLGDTAAALRLHLAIAQVWPRDMLNLRIAQFHQLNRGDFAGMRRMAEAALPHNPDVPHLKGILAFALEQTGETGAGLALALEAAGAAFDPWAEHAAAHGFERMGRSREAIGWLLPRSDGWVRCSSFLYTHNWWHTALFHIALGEAEAALALFDARVWGVRKAYCQDQANAVSLLARLELAGCDVGDRWAELAGWLKPRTGEHVNGLLDLHYAYGLARAGADAEADRMLKSLEARACSSPDPLWQQVMPEAARGVVAYARGALPDAADALGRVLPRLHLAGGSSTQRGLFQMLHADALAAG